MEIKPGKNYLGDFLVESGEITQAQLDDALRYQKEKAQSGKKGFLGQILMELGYCTEETITRAMAEKAGVSYYSLVSNPVDVNAGNLITPEAARRYQSLPVAFENGRLVVAMMHPNDIIAIDDLRIMTGHDIKPVIVPDYELMAAIEQFSRTGTGVEKMEEEEYLKESGDTEDTKPAVQLADMIFYQAVASNASDVHIEPQEKNLRTRFRIDGVLHEVMQHPRRLHPPLISRLKVMANMDIAERRIPQDGRITMKVEDKTIDVRVASMPTVFGEKLTLRLLDRSAQLLSLTELGFPDSQLALFNKIMRLPYGFILVTGPTGSGKSTTLYASLVELNQVDKQIITLEDPIERRLEGINQV
ncbi:MAG: ATPase, T2SS/T4P/T4SS family, partial [Candidatus Contubernalis sp.]|nr:ATPase, T2SS/T4P/T4SS family [Candidatus Contubernalis sp.]